MDQHLVTFRLGVEEFGIDVMEVQEIIRVPGITFVPGSPEFVEGIINLRGSVVPVINLKRKFQIDPTGDKEETADGDQARIVVIRLKEKILGIRVDQVTEVLYLPGDSIDPPPPTALDLDTSYIKGLGKIGDRLIVLLDLAKALNQNSAERAVS